jgi:outer membrane protein
MIDLHGCLLQWGHEYWRTTGPLRIIKRTRDRAVATAAVVIGLSALSSGFASADTLEWALAQAYQNNPQLNSQRAIARQADEAVPQALSGYRPKVSISANAGEQYQETEAKVSASGEQVLSNGSVAPIGQTIGQTTGGTAYTHAEANFVPRSVGLTATETLYNGNQNATKTRQAESQVSAARETLRLIEENVLLNAATAYMNLLRDEATLDLQRRNVQVLQEQLRQTRDQFNVGEVTKTDVAQAESRLAGGRSSVLAAESNYVSSKAVYRQAIGVEAGKLAPGSPVDRLSPKVLSEAIVLGRAQNPAVTAAMFGVDVAKLQVSFNEGALLPTLNLVTNIQNAWEQNLGVAPNAGTFQQFNATVMGQLTVPLYQGGVEYSNIRQAKEALGQKRLDLETARDQAQASVVQAWGQLEAAKAEIQATQSQVTAAEIALNGVREEARVGQRTTLDVLNAQQELVNDRVALVSAQRDRVVASYTLLNSVGGLTAQRLGLKVPVYDPIVHYTQVRDSWAGVRNPDGR